MFSVDYLLSVTEVTKVTDKFIFFYNKIPKQRNYLCAKIAKSLYCINRIKHFVTKKSLKMLYDAI
jgi:hypothetical protein